MTTTEPSTDALREELLAMISETSERELLLSLRMVAQSRATTTGGLGGDYWASLPRARKESIRQGLAEARAGQVVTSAEMKTRLGIFER